MRTAQRTTVRRGGLNGAHVLCLKATVGLLRRELHLLTLLERFEARTLDVLVVDEQLVTAVVRSNEAPALFGIEELHGAGRHAGSPFAPCGFRRVVQRPRPSPDVAYGI